MSPGAPAEAKARHLRAMYRERGEPGRAEVAAEHRRLFPGGEPRLDQVLVSAWKEGRELAGQRYDYRLQAWLAPDGSRVD